MNSGVSQLAWFFLFAFALQGITAIVIILFKNKSLKTTSILLAINLFGASMIALVITLVESGLILDFPHFFRLPSALYYAMFPAAYLYVRLIVTDQTRLHRVDFLHFIPALLHFVELLPFYLKTSGEKAAIIAEIMQYPIQLYEHGEGWLPPYLHNIIRGVMGMVYGALMWQLVRQSLPYYARKANVQIVERWLFTLASINFFIGLFTVLFLVLVFIPSPMRSAGLSALFLVSLSLSNFYLFFRPEILYGLPRFIEKASINAPVVVMNLLEPKEKQGALPEFLEKYRN